MVGTGQDVTGRRQLEEQRQRFEDEERRTAEFREAFIDVISHELHTPITTILGAAQLLDRPSGALPEGTQRTLLADIRVESERLHRLVEDMLVLSRLERGRLVVESESLEIRRLLDRVVSRAAGARAADTTVRIEPDIPTAAGEATYVEQVLRNLVGNAAKYSPVGSPITVRATRSGDDVAIRVLDEGPGVPEASLPRLFDLYYRDPHQARVVSGSGIGLFVCASLVNAMGGRIWVASRPEGGTEFGFTLPALAVDDVDRPDTSL